MTLATMLPEQAEKLTATQLENFWYMLSEGHWSLAHAHDVLAHPDENRLDLFQIAGLAQAIACFQCVEA